MADQTTTQNTVIGLLQNRPITAGALIAALFSVISFAAAVPTSGPLVVSTLSGLVLVPSGNASYCVAPGSIVQLDGGAPGGEVKDFSDCSSGSAASPITINPSTDAAINGGSYTININGGSESFRKTSAGSWQPF